jgi:hypothetical protein
MIKNNNLTSGGWENSSSKLIRLAFGPVLEKTLF